MKISRALVTVVALVTLLGAAVTGCAERKAEPPSAPAALAQHGVQPGQPSGPVPPAERAMRITIDTSVTVANIDAASRAVRDLTAEAGGYVGEARSGGGEEVRTAWFEVHVPVPKLAAFRAAVAALGEVQSDAEKAEDVTEQRADIRARLGNARAEERRLLELLDKRTGSLADVVAVEKELASVRETIERMEAQERVLEGQIASATVKINLSTRYAAARLGPGKRIVRAAGDGIESAGSFLVGVAIFVASAGPTLLILGLFGFGVFRGVRFFVRRGKARA